MASNRVTFVCGHTVDKDLNYRKLTQWKTADPVQRQMCAECYEHYRHQKKLEYEKQNTQAALKAKERNLPSLVGSQKQVEFATSLREAICEVLDLQTALQTLVQEQTEASFWLELTKPKEGRTAAQQIAARIIATALATPLRAEEASTLGNQKAYPPTKTKTRF